MVTLKTLLKYEKLHEIVEEFLLDKCYEYNHARKHFDRYEWETDYPRDNFTGFEIKDNEIIIYFEDEITDCEPRSESYRFSLDILFKDDFYEILVEEFDQKKKIQDEKNEVKKREMELKCLAKLKEKYESEK